jgi:hypothetical protein
LEYVEFFLGWFLGIISLIIAQITGHYLSRRNLKVQQEHSERILRMQLYREEKRKALVELDELLKKRYKTFSEFKNAVESFLDGNSAIFLSDKLSKELRNEVSSVDTFIHQREVDLGMINEYPEEWQEWVQDLDPIEELKAEIETRLSGLKSSMRSKIRKYFSEE